MSSGQKWAAERDLDERTAKKVAALRSHGEIPVVAAVQSSVNYLESLGKDRFIALPQHAWEGINYVIADLKQLLEPAK